MPSRIAVIVDREGLGDALLKLPMLRAIGRAHPQGEVWWIASNHTVMADALRAQTENLVARVLTGVGLSGPPHRVVPRLLKLPRFDLVFDTRSRILDVLLSKAFLRPGEFYSCLPGFFLSSRRPVGVRNRPHGNGQRAMAMATSAFGEKADGSGGLPVSAAYRALARRDLPAGPSYVGLAPGSRQPQKNWPLDRFADVAASLAANGCVPVFIVGPWEHPWVEQLRQRVPAALAPDSVPIDRALALMSRLDVVLANDSGIGHLAASIGVPLVSLFGPSDAERWRPFGEHVRVLRAQDFGGNTMDSIPVEPVLAALSEFLIGTREPPAT
jgi:ADP-heptose:LPS heptosyltransferase